MGEIDFSPLAVTVQATGTFLLALMLAQLGRIVSRRYARTWAAGWAAMFLALLSVRAFIVTSNRLTWIAYLGFEWLFLVMLWSGCRTAARHAGRAEELLVYALPVAIVLAAVMTTFAPSFNDLFTMQAAIVAAGAAASLYALRFAQRDRRGNGWWTLAGGLAFMALLYASYVPLYAIHTHRHELAILRYSSIADLMVSIVLGFGMILMTAEDSKFDLHDALSQLAHARSTLERKLNTDPLTDALNRHAFYSMQKGEQIAADNLSGVVLMIDIDGLKQVNDTDGHAAGDAVIRAAANAIRMRIRADDLLFRWGGDEFVAIVPNSTMAQVQSRLDSIEHSTEAHLPNGTTVQFFMSWGGAEFGPGRPLDVAMKEADDRMYESRTERPS